MYRSFVLVVVLLGMIAANSAHAQVVQIVNQKSGFALTAQPTPGQVLIQEPPKAGNVYQHWVLIPVGNHTRIYNPATCLFLETLKGDSKTPVSLYGWHDAPTQLWIIQPVPRSIYVELIPSLHTNRRLDVPGGRSLVSLIQIYKSNSTDAQRWNLIPVW